jgi:DNA polymerase-1
VSESERVAINMPIQGSAADIIKIAMINIYNRIKAQEKLKMLIQVHDELVFEVDNSFLEEAKLLIKEEMENVLKGKYDSELVLVVDIEVGESWGG